MSNIRDDGEYFGYPNCCVESFKRKHGKPRWFDEFFQKYPNAAAKVNGTGFIPCEAHLKELEEGGEVDDLIQERACPTPFPHGPEELCFSFLGKIMREKGLKKTMDFLVWLHNMP